jgi:hypothetical protein
LQAVINNAMMTIAPAFASVDTRLIKSNLML